MNSSIVGLFPHTQARFGLSLAQKLQWKSETCENPHRLQSLPILIVPFLVGVHTVYEGVTKSFHYFVYSENHLIPFMVVSIKCVDDVYPFLSFMDA